MTMTDTIDINDKLPPIEVRKPWRQKLPNCYTKRIDELKRLREELRASCAVLQRMHFEFGVPDTCADYNQKMELDRVRDEITAALVLLGCAADKLVGTVPTEELMDPESLRQFWQ
jgi:hypothetical protein